MKHFRENPDHQYDPPEDCYGCRIAGITFGSVPGGTRPGSFKLQHQRTFEEDMHAYREAKRAGEQPDQISRKSIEKKRRITESIERGKKKVESWME